MSIEQRFCTISAVQNGWLVDLGRPFRDGSFREDQMRVFTDAGEMGRWVVVYFGGPDVPFPETRTITPTAGIYDMPGVSGEERP